jgi:hypothetical protein
MKILTLAILLIATQTVMPVPRKTAKNPTSSTSKSAKIADLDESKTAVPLVQSPVGPTSETADSQRIANENKQIHAAIDSLPKKDSWDMAYIIATFGLVVIGFLTLGAICFQSIQTKKAAQAAQKSAGIAEMALTLAERADVLLDAAGLVPNGPPTPDSHVALKFKNFGRTRAKNVRSSIVIIIPGVPDSEPSPETFVIGPGGTRLVGFFNFREFLNQETFERIRNGMISLKFSGTITYDDIFGEHYTLECKGILVPKTGAFILGENYPRKDL